MNPNRYISVDDLQAQTTLEEAAAKCGVNPQLHGSSNQVRLDCPFNCPGDHAGQREISVDTDNAQKVFMCHAYQCQFRGNMLTLMHGWSTGTKPTGGKLKGDEFKRVRSLLAGALQTATAPATSHSPPPIAERPVPRNIPLALSENEKARELISLDDKFITDVSAMPPPAASYVRRHPSLSPEWMKKWRVGVLPHDGGGDKRAWSLRGQLLFPILSEQDQLLAWVARDPNFENKDQAFQSMSAEQRAKEKKPAKHRFPVDFHRGLELFGQQASRLKNLGYREAIARSGIIVCEGFNDVIGLDQLGIPSVAIMSNKVTEEQVAKIERWSKALAQGKVMILFDADEAGDNGAKEALWLLSQRGLNVRLGWNRAMHGGTFNGRQPESLTIEEWNKIASESQS